MKRHLLATLTITAALVTAPGCRSNPQQPESNLTPNPPPSEGCFASAGRILVGFEPDVTQEQAAEFLLQLGLDPLNWMAYWQLRWVAVSVDAGSEDSWVAELQQQAIVTFAERDWICPID